jgi:Fe-S cluster assembly ATP-binding protein
MRQADKPKDMNAEVVSVFKFREILKEKLKLLKMDESFANRYLNEGFSGGEKKKCEILQMAILRPKIAVLDETDSGLDIDALKTVAKGINTLSHDTGILFITHYQRVLRYVRPNYVHILLDGRIVKSGKEELALELEEKGYDWIKKELSIG